MQGMLGVVVTREEFEKGLLRASGGTAWESLSDDETSEIEMTREYFFGRVLATPDDCGFPVFGVENAFRTDRFRFLTVLTLLCCDVERRYEKLFAFLQDDISKKLPTADTMIRLWAEAGQAHSGLLPLFFRAGRADEVHLRPRRRYLLHPAASAF